MADDALAQRVDAVQRWAAFTADPRGGNPAGVVLDADDWPEASMQQVAAAVGYSETAFVTDREDDPDGTLALRVRFFAPAGEVPFCGHATLATAVSLVDRYGPRPLRFSTNGGEVGVRTSREPDGTVRATLTSVEPSVAEADPADVSVVLGCLGWTPEDLDEALPPRVAFAGAHHLVLSTPDRERLRALTYDVAPLRDLMQERGWTTVHVAFRQNRHTFDVRDLFPVGGVVEDPATGAAGAAFGAYLRSLGLVDLPARVILHQGEELGRRSLLLVDVPPSGPVEVTGTAVPMTVP